MTMLKDPSNKYRAFPVINLPDRTWPSQTITQAPIWLSSDLRDGNQSLIEPMDAGKKMRFFKTLVQVGLKEIEVGFPSASQTDFDFVRELIQGGHIPNDVTIQVLTQAREDLITRTFESLKGAKQAIVHYYNATAPSFRRIVFNQDKAGVINIAVNAAQVVKRLADAAPETDWRFEYSPEVFSSTETDFAVEVCNAVIEVFQPTPTKKLILNLPATVEAATPNIYADQIEYFGRKINKRDSVLISLHTHNDRGTGVAATELGLMAGADRVEGCLFGNGERTGNVDLVTVALNMYSQGVDPQLDFSDIDALRKVVEECNQLPVHPRHPYVGDLVHTAFSGSHQDAIRKGFSQQDPNGVWEVPYLPIDPADIGRSYEAVIRVNSQSGKGGITYLLEQEYGISLPRRMQIEFSQVVQRETDRLGLEMSAKQIYALLESEYLQATAPYALKSHRLQEENGTSAVDVEVATEGEIMHWRGIGKGPLEALVAGLPVKLEIMDYHEHSIGAGSNARAAAYIEVRLDGERPLHGIGIDENITTASIRALFSALNRALREATSKAA
ncbi:MAG: 2-isopropylmalate synthase [Gammaproteobacteria bacterium]|uniref:2-isopropylmalate synthase n=1 Tax=Stutzerimonas xanthomarina TaxID=271420 RepID=UPI000E8FC7D8|nr:2-isopropylmalate synthase [Stutzerimonas xanthomarina]MBU0854459.1 2-isopropylmalate synthase [Gammaproteobacteria bacterium]HAW21893.1 2-isopropylmalate synthase [Pseudomonas sp.]MBK3848186.1 2-isopropylmalate synthase [Stutzerimonas xanthomarina]MBU1301265.1 2-isopropylmalate synthase [Gammaproteobacteria bacterium]MBU1459664.1 2-isopropylmalate synthase [Gammaproteobacteria bacterium]